MTAPRRVVVVAAFAAEVAHLPDGLEVVTTGLGKAAAAAVTTAMLLDGRDRTGLEVWNLGTAGALRDGLTGIHEPGLVLNHDINGAAIRALGLDPNDELVIPGGDDTVLASGDVFVADPVQRARLAARAHLVDMEAYGVVVACRRLDVPVRLVKHVSDNADGEAMSWADALETSSQALATWAHHHLPT